MTRITIPMPCPSKANNYEIHFDANFWDVIKQYVYDLRKYTRKPLYWIGPTKEMKQIENAIGYASHRILPEDTDKPVRVLVWVSDVVDADNALKAILDGIEKGKRIKNDKQVKQIIVTKVPMKNKSFDLDIEVLDIWPFPDSANV